MHIVELCRAIGLESDKKARVSLSGSNSLVCAEMLDSHAHSTERYSDCWSGRNGAQRDDLDDDFVDIEEKVETV